MSVQTILFLDLTNHILQCDPDSLGGELWEAVRESLYGIALDLSAQHRHQGVLREPEGRALLLLGPPWQLLLGGELGHGGGGAGLEPNVLDDPDVGHGGGHRDGRGPEEARARLISL